MVRWDPFWQFKKQLEQLSGILQDTSCGAKGKMMYIFNIIQWKKTNIYTVLLLHVLYSFPNLSHSFFNLFSTIPLYTYLLHPTACSNFPDAHLETLGSTLLHQQTIKVQLSAIHRDLCPNGRYMVGGSFSDCAMIECGRKYIICWFMKNNAETVQLNMLCYSNSIIYALSWYDVTIHDLR